MILRVHTHGKVADIDVGQNHLSVALLPLQLHVSPSQLTFALGLVILGRREGHAVAEGLFQDEVDVGRGGGGRVGRDHDVDPVVGGVVRDRDQDELFYRGGRGSF